MTGVVPASPFTRIDVVRGPWPTYRLVGYIDSHAIRLHDGTLHHPPWHLHGVYLTRRGAARAARRILRRQQRPLTISTVTQESR